MGTVQGRKLVFLGGGDGVCYAFAALTSVPKHPVTLKAAWWVDCNPPEYRSFGGMDMMVHYTLGDKRRRDTINDLNDGSFVGMSEIIATPVFYQGRVYVAIGRDPDHGRGRGWEVALPRRRDRQSTLGLRFQKLWPIGGQQPVHCGCRRRRHLLGSRRFASRGPGL